MPKYNLKNKSLIVPPSQIADTGNKTPEKPPFVLNDTVEGDLSSNCFDNENRPVPKNVYKQGIMSNNLRGIPLSNDPNQTSPKYKK